MHFEKIVNELQCSICLSLLTIPYVIPCGHSFCRDCIQNYGKSTSKVKCPLCKMPFNCNKINLNVSLQAVLNIIECDNSKTKTSLISRKKSSCSNFLICLSNIPDEYRDLIDRFCKQFKIKTNSNINTRVTHLIQGSIDINQPFIARRTLKYLEALVRGIWIINLEWIIQSLKCDMILYEEDYEMQGDEFALQTPKQSRLQNGMKRLLKHYEFYIDPIQIQKTFLNEEHLINLINLCGGDIVNIKDKTSLTIIIKVIQDPQINKNWKDCNPIQVNQRWLFDSISNFKVQNFYDYLIN